MALIIDYILHLGDNALIQGHRNSEWCGHGPVLEQDIAITNISLDLIGQARNFYQLAASMKADGSTEDTFAYLRNPDDFKNFIITELPKGDWALTILPQFFFSNYQNLLYRELENHTNPDLAAIAAKALKEVTYHLRWSSEWVIRLGDGTEESHRRLKDALQLLWPYTGEFFASDKYDAISKINRTELQNSWMKKTKEIFSEALIEVPADFHSAFNGDHEKHTTHLEELLTEMQFLQRTYPGAEW